MARSPPITPSPRVAAIPFITGSVRFEIPGDQNSAVDVGLALKFSGSSDGEVAYTRVKYVKKIHGGPAGKVTYTQDKSLRGAVTPERMARLTREA